MRPKKSRGAFTQLSPSLYRIIYFIIGISISSILISSVTVYNNQRTDLTSHPHFGAAIYTGTGHVVIGNIAANNIVEAIWQDPSIINSDNFSDISSEQRHDIYNAAVQQRDSLLAQFFNRVHGIKEKLVPPGVKLWHGLRKSQHYDAVSNDGGDYPPDHTRTYSNFEDISLKERMNVWHTRRNPIIVGAISSSSSSNSGGSSSGSSSYDGNQKKKAKKDDSGESSDDEEKDVELDFSSDGVCDTLLNIYGIPKRLVDHLKKLYKEKDELEGLEKSVLDGFERLYTTKDAKKLKTYFKSYREGVRIDLKTFGKEKLINMGDDLSDEAELFM